MRTFVASLATLLTTVAPTAAWEAGRDGAICTLTHSEAEGTIRLTFDPAGPLYTLTAIRPGAWPDAPIFGIVFQGGAEITITTDRHSLSAKRRRLSVTDTGFGNVLAGLSRNATATLFAGPATVSVSLDGAAPEVAAFEACATAPTA
jgi:hypothetical protein